MEAPPTLFKFKNDTGKKNSFVLSIFYIPLKGAKIDSKGGEQYFTL